MKVITGGQTGADIGALRAARRVGIPTGGFAPTNFLTERGQCPELAGFGLRPQGDYAERTRLNVEAADMVVILGRPSPGSDLTGKLVARHGLKKPLLWLQWSAVSGWQDRRPDDLLWNMLAWCQPATLMVAGNRESKNPGIEQASEDLLYAVLRDW